MQHFKKKVLFLETESFMNERKILNLIQNPTNEKEVTILTALHRGSNKFLTATHRSPQMLLQGNVFRNEQISKKEPINFFKFYDNEGTIQLLMQFDHFISPTVWYLFFGLNFITSILVMFFHKGVVVSVPCDIDKQ